jgi:hypothetical protein
MALYFSPSLLKQPVNISERGHQFSFFPQFHKVRLRDPFGVARLALLKNDALDVRILMKKPDIIKIFPAPP